LTDGCFSSSNGGSREKQAGDIRARNQQHERDYAHRDSGNGQHLFLIARIHAASHSQQLHAPERLRINFTPVVLGNTPGNFC